jgi:hypothetical protein
MTIFGIIFFGIFLIAAVVWPFIDEFSDKCSWWDFSDYCKAIGSAVFKMGVSVVLLLFIFVFSLAITYSGNGKIDETSVKTVPIHSIGVTNGSEFGGNFFLGIGSVDGESYPVYQFYTLSEDNRYKIHQVNANNYDIVCTDSIAPSIQYCDSAIVTPPIGLLFNADIKNHREMKDSKGTIYIPSNSIVADFKIDL